MNAKEFIAAAREFEFKLKSGCALIAFSLAATVMEAIGITMFLPIFQYLRMDGDLTALNSESGLWEYLVPAYRAIGIPINLATLLCAAFLCFFGRQAFTYARTVYRSVLEEGLIRDVRNKGFKYYLEGDAAYHDATPVGDLANALNNEVRPAVDALTSPFIFVSYVLMVLIYLGVLVGLSPEMTGVATIVLLFAAWLLRGLMVRSTDTGRRVFAANTDMSSFLVQRLQSPRLVRLSGSEVAEQRDMEHLTEQQRKYMVRNAALIARTSALIEPIVIGMSCVFLYFAVTLFGLTIEVVGLYMVIALRLVPVVNATMHARQFALSMRGSLEAVHQRLLEMKGCAETRSGTRRLSSLRDGIEFQDVCFRYAADSPETALSNINLKIRAGEMTGIVGPSGAGKSTLIDLLPRLRTPTSGTIRIDGIQLDEYSIESLRSAISYVSQSPLIFNVTIAQHIRYGKPDATDDEIRDAAELAGAAQFVEANPNGYDSHLGEGGVRLSGGQRQRLDLARALVRKAPVLILDEPTSDLDADAEERFRAILARIRETTDVTIVVVAHRLSTVAASDQIVTLEHSKITSVGTHAELIKQNGWYSGAYSKLQLAASSHDQAAPSNDSAPNQIDSSR